MDAARADRERMKTLLVEAISTLCRNGLQYDEELTVEGLIGITLDKRDVFLISVKETFALPPHLSKKKEHVAESSPSSEKKSRRASKRSASTHDDGPAEKHRHKGASRISCDSEQQLQDSENEDNVDTYDQNSRNSIDNSEHSLGAGREKDDCIVIDPDLSIKTEGIKAERLSQNTCMYSDSAQEPASSQTSGDEDSRSRHPAGVDPDQLGVLFPIELKAEQDSDPDISVFSTHGGEVIRMPSSMKRQSSDQPVPVNIVMQGASTSSAQGFQNMQDFSSPGNWNSPASQQQIAHQAPSSSGASQQVDHTYVLARPAGKKKSDNKNLQIKYNALMEYERGKVPKMQIAREYDVAFRTLTRWIQNSAEIKEAYTKLGSFRKRARGTAYDDIELALKSWITSMKAKKLPISTLTVQQKAQELACRFGHRNFKCTVGWLGGFRRRHGITFTAPRKKRKNNQ